MKALIVIRLSRLTDVTSSPERQMADCQELCTKRGYDVVGVVEDLDVSAGKTSPWQRDALKGWIGTGPDDPGQSGEFDVIVFQRADRIVRRLFDLADLIRWSRKHGVTLVSATESHFDLSTEFGDIIALLVAKVAEMELAAISQRNASAFRHNIKEGKWRGGTPPWGYVPTNETGEWRLQKAPDQAKIITEVVERVLAGEPLRAIAHDLTERGIPTPRDQFARSQGREIKGYSWSSTSLKRSLTSKTMLGHAVSKGETVRNDDTSPVVRSEPILKREVFDRLCVEIASRDNRKEPTKRSTALLLQILFCGLCGKPMYRLKGGQGRKPRYRCASAQYKKTCGNTSVQLEYADDAVQGLIMGLLGNAERLERVWDSGSDHSAELADINAALVDLTGLLSTGAYKPGTPQRVALNKQIETLAARQAALSAEEVKPAGWVWQPTGEKFSDWWERQDITSQNMWLGSMGVRLKFTRGSFQIDLGDIFKMAEQMSTESTPAAGLQTLFAAMKEGPDDEITADDELLLTEMTDGPVAGVEITADELIFHPRDTSLEPLRMERQDSDRPSAQRREDKRSYGL